MANIDDLVNNNSFPEWLTVSDKGNKLVDEIKLAKYLEKKYHFTSNQFIEHGYWFDPKSRQWKNYADSVIEKSIKNEIVPHGIWRTNVNTDLKLSEITGLKMYFFTGLNAALYVVPCNLSCDMIYQKF